MTTSLLEVKELVTRFESDGRELRAVVDGRQAKAEALRRYHDFSAAHAWKFDWLLRVQWLIPRVPPRLLHLGLRLLARRPASRWAFEHYLAIAPPEYVTAPPARTAAADPDQALAA